jgi:hypothetical protein
LSKTTGGQWSARYSGPETGAVEVTAPSREQALQKIRSELRYRLELCPCTGEQYKDLEIELVEEA